MAKSTGVGSLLKQRDSTRAEVLAHLLSGKRITGMDAVFQSSTTRLSAVIFALQEHGWRVERDSHVVGCKDGRITTVTRYWLPPTTIGAALQSGAEAWCAEVVAARATLRKKAAEAEREARRRNQRLLTRATQSGQCDLFSAGAFYA